MPSDRRVIDKKEVAFKAAFKKKVWCVDGRESR